MARPKLHRPAAADDPSRPSLFNFESRTVGEILDWYEGQDGGDNLVALTERQRVRALFREAFGEQRLADCRPFQLQAWIQKQPGLKKAWSRKRWAGTLLRPFNHAAKLGFIPRNPFQGVSFTEGQDGRDLTEPEFRTMLRLATPAFRKVLMFLRWSGARPGELRAIEPEHVQLENQCIILRDHKTAKKTRRPRRIMLNGPLLKLVKVLLVSAEIRAAAGGAANLFVNTFERPWTIGALCRALDKIRKAAGLPKDAKLYGCRHAFATGAIINNVNVAVVQELMGHTNLKTTQRYIHLAERKDHLIQAVEQATKKK